VRKPNVILTAGLINHSELGTVKETNPMPMHYGDKKMKGMKGMKGKKEEMAEMKKSKPKAKKSKKK